MTILSLNVWGGRRTELIPYLVEQATAVDVFCLQEMFTASDPRIGERELPGHVPDLFEQLQVRLSDHVGFCADDRDDGSKLALFVRHTLPILSQGKRTLFTRIPPAPLGALTTNYVGTQYVTVQSPAGPLTVVHFHGFWEPDEGEDKPPRAEQTTNVLELVDSFKTPVVLCGDFNTNPRTESMARLSEHLRNLTLDFEVTTTRPSFTKWHGTIADYCLVSPELRVSRFEVPNAEVSDHLPLIVTFVLPH